MYRVRDTGDATLLLYFHDAILEYSLSAACPNDRGLFRIRYGDVVIDICLDLVFPVVEIIVCLHRDAYFDARNEVLCFSAYQAGKDLGKGGSELGKVNGLDAVATRL